MKILLDQQGKHFDKPEKLRSTAHLLILLLSDYFSKNVIQGAKHPECFPRMTVEYVEAS